ncbi:hypothetical protein DES53_103291 [Roseimicrobium gellanilyticum]|uniref:6-bladed beta-propeller protein n=1 Tax=Roseimicrobium gellanilyticum TaxID=748857 RepID=A0A366HQT9_9BACT|nr:hypothetical protein [Roseimicrobium gellanilyticum]RBP45293.1 hypothetical protein DES53_103291 [Roseimicrobium gellanilyticum]
MSYRLLLLAVVCSLNVQAADALPKGEATAKSPRERDVLELRAADNATLVVALVTEDKIRRVVLFDPFGEATKSRNVGENFLNLGDLISPDGKFIVMPRGHAEPIEVYKLDSSIFEAIEKDKPHWRFQVVTKLQRASTVQNYIGWNGMVFSINAEYGATTSTVVCDVESKAIKSSAPLVAEEK